MMRGTFFVFYLLHPPFFIFLIDDVFSLGFGVGNWRRGETGFISKFEGRPIKQMNHNQGEKIIY